ncbi:MarR family winged helix-turn-helix transcriptional regulator [Flectobacillus sp. BAB-3569]|uniref:MarR family winged helix-turn-helix transcriptional regulator n=1 Tax=Flectobacillus sp. BAB-3569 TaxID=1509483 RepID=UPI000BA372D6|nr:MarR family transcriptional regulator [Flectobacillus sp. BAB-3569]PAC26663.1 MarR family transcriptional regulator [Flectobacillus sp. BAB-3569]
MNQLKLENQLCFPFYAISRQITALYRPLLEPLDLTYPQYLVLLVLWEHKNLSVKELGKKLLLDSGTLTPLLKRMEQDGLVNRQRDKADERVVFVSLTNKGIELENEAKDIPFKLASCLALSMEEFFSLKAQLDKLMETTSALK